MRAEMEQLLRIKGQQGLLAATANWEEAKNGEGCPPLEPARKAARQLCLWLPTSDEAVGALLFFAAWLVGLF